LLLAVGPASAPTPLGTTSSSTTCTPAFARCAAIRDPMVPAPSTATLRISRSARFVPKVDPALIRSPCEQGYGSAITPSSQHPATTAGHIPVGPRVYPVLLTLELRLTGGDRCEYDHSPPPFWRSE